MNNDGSQMGFTTAASDIVGSASPAITQVVHADLTKTPTAFTLASRTRGGDTAGDGPSDNASLTSGGTWIAFDTTSRNLVASALMGANGPFAGLIPPRTVLLWMQGANDVWSISDDSNDQPLPAGSVAGMTSPHGNYIVFVSSGQALMRYLGPK
jgi:hypothetical protein